MDLLAQLSRIIFYKFKESLMRMYIKSLFSLIVVGSVACAANLCWADYSYHSDRLAKKVSKERMEDIYKQINLTEKQKKKLEGNRKKHHSKIKELRKRRRSLRKELNKELKRKELDSRKVDKVKGRIKDIQSEITDRRLKGVMGVREILTPEQFSIFSDLTERE